MLDADGSDGGNKRKRDEENSGCAMVLEESAAIPEVDDTAFWQFAPFPEVRAEYERRMGVIKTQRKYKFVTDLVDSLENNQDQLPMELSEEDDPDGDHIIFEMEERRGAGSVKDYFGSTSVTPVFRPSNDTKCSELQQQVMADGSSPLKRPRADDDLVDKYQVDTRGLWSDKLASEDG
ncbi:unnamed protein product [Eruca vesicaria subsp. sativa]|uniref:Uncharacterized protein n=1 Tax=Eruca vesicaria subsp. sativa TaxID=29727 RepID=A0ABC8LSV3_ERUVS|nr:unnamed protein product [Eruca vesicaria subsp. sativa]